MVEPEPALGRRGGELASAPRAPALSVVVPTRETRALVLRCLAALAAARPAPAEVIVVDDGSSDGTAAAIGASYPGVRLLRHPRPLGFTRAANAGLALASGQLLLLLNSDAEVAPEALAALLEAFADDPLLGVAGAALYYPSGEPQWSGGAAPSAAWLLALGSGVPWRLRALPRWRRIRPVSGHGQRPVRWVTGAAIAFRREVWDAVGPLDPRFALYGQDLDFCLRAGDRGWRVAVVARGRVLHHHGATVSGAAGVTTARHNAPLLWADLVRWAGKRGGGAAARRTARLLRAGGALQRLLLFAEGLLGGERRRRAALEGAALAAAVAAAVAAAATTGVPPQDDPGADAEASPDLVGGRQT